MGQPLAVHRAIMVVDVERFGDPARTNLNQLAIRAALYKALAEAFAQSGIGWDSCVSEDRGDGALILISPEVPKTRLVAGLPGLLAAAVTGTGREHCSNPANRPARGTDGLWHLPSSLRFSVVFAASCWYLLQPNWLHHRPA